MVEKEAKIKIRKCRVCGKEYNSYKRPWGLWGAKYTCSEECHTIYANKRKAEIKRADEDRKEKTKEDLKTWLIISLITAVIGALVGIPGGILGILAGLGIGFIAPTIIYIICASLT